MARRNVVWRRAAALVAALALPSAPGVADAQDYRTTVEAKVAESNNRLAEAFAQGPVLGQFIERLPGTYVFAPTDRSLPIVLVGNPNQVGTLAVGPEVLAKGLIPAGERTLVLEGYIFPSPAPPPVSMIGLENAFTAATDITERLENAARPGSLSVESRRLDRSSELGRATLDDMARIAQDYRAAVDAGDDAIVEAIVDRWRQVRSTIAATLSDGTEFKTFYNAPDNYALWRYDRIFADAAAVVAIGESGQTRARCSGVLIAADLVLTAGHCFAGPPPMEPGQLEVWFGFAERPDGSSSPPIRRTILADPVAPAPGKWPDLMDHRFGSSLFDYAIVRFAARSGEPLLPKIEIVPGRSVTPAPQCLRRSPPARADGVYVIGYPRGNPVMVHDNGRVELPFRVLAGDDFNLLRLEVDADFRGTADHAEVLREFDESYVLDDSAALHWWYLFDIRDGGQPRMGIAADTFRGNSGGPVYDHERGQCVVGILIRGMGDTGERLEADWKVHERVLPIRAILDDLSKDPTTAPVLENGDVRIVE